MPYPLSATGRGTITLVDSRGTWAMASIKDVEVTAPYLRYDQRNGSVTLGRHR